MVKTKKKNFSLTALPFLVLSIFLNIFFFTKINNTSKINLVERVIDGDTFVLSFGQRVRLRSIDSPEIGFCGSEEAKIALEKLILGKRVVLDDFFTDEYGRVVAFVYSGKNFINKQIVDQGWAKFDSNKSDQSEILKQAYQEAQNNHLGIFSSLCRQTTNPDNPDCKIKGNLEKNDTEKRYFVPGCQSYDHTIVEKNIGEEWFCTEKEALTKGYKKGPNCP